jgi:hypothetical protein
MNDESVYLKRLKMISFAGLIKRFGEYSRGTIR